MLKKATSQQIKRHNSRLVLKTIYDQRRVSRADIARSTHLTRTTVSDVVAELIENGLVEEVGYGPSAGGTPPMMLSLVDDSFHLIGIDLANDKFRGGVINLRGKIKEWVSIPIQQAQGEEALDLVYELIDRLLEASDRPVLGIGIGTPGLVNARDGVIRNAVNLGWRDLLLRKLLSDNYSLPIYVDNDSHVAALGEFIFGTHPHGDSLIVVKAGRGTSAGIVIENKIYLGDGFGAGEIGHVVIEKDGQLCRCGHYGCLETVASTQALVRGCQEIASRDPKSVFNHLPDPQALSIKDVLAAYEQGDPAVAALVYQAGVALGQAVASLVCAFNIHHIYLAGSMARFGNGLLDPLRETVRQNALTALTESTQVEIASLGADIVVLGAAAMLLANELELV